MKIQQINNFLLSKKISHIKWFIYKVLVFFQITGLSVYNCLRYIYKTRDFSHLFKWLKKSYQGWIFAQHEYINDIVVQLKKNDEQTLKSLRSNLFLSVGMYNAQALERLYNLTKGLHQLLHNKRPPADRFSFSILIPVFNPSSKFFHMALRSALLQSSPDFEVLIGLDGPQPKAVHDVIDAVRSELPNLDSKLRIFNFEKTTTDDGGISSTLNKLATNATKRFLLLMDHDDWIRPDILFRYEQTLLLQNQSPDKTVLYCNEFKIDEHNRTIPGSSLHKPDSPSFPYIFINYICHCLMIPKTLYIESGGCRRECDGAQDFDLCLRLDLLDAKFMNVPFFLYAWRSHSQSTAKNTGNKNYAHHAGIHALTDYTTKKGLNWQITDGYSPTSYRAIPQSTTTPTVHAIMLFKDQKDITIKSIQSLIAQTNVHVLITAIDNDSTDLSIGNLLETMGVEVLRIEEPFNYSRLNNIAVTHSMYKHKYPLLFINNDVILNPNAVKEMTRWVYEKNIGMVGCRLHYPDGTLQHGGVDLKADEPGNLMSWSHSECLLPFTRTSTAKITRTVDAVTAACSLIPYDVFTKVGGFDDIHYPIAFSDTNLAVKIRKAGFICIYTPYATGTHHESLSRSKYNIEDYEGSYWLHRQLNNSVTTSSFYFN